MEQVNPSSSLKSVPSAESNRPNYNPASVEHSEESQSSISRVLPQVAPISGNHIGDEAHAPVNFAEATPYGGQSVVVGACSKVESFFKKYWWVLVLVVLALVAWNNYCENNNCRYPPTMNTLKETVDSLTPSFLKRAPAFAPSFSATSSSFMTPVSMTN